MHTLYGIPNCDTVKKARAWLLQHSVAYTFHDFKVKGVPAGPLTIWTQAVGWGTLLNRKGTTWRKLEAATQAAVVDAASAESLMRANPSLIKRPVMDWGQDITVGFDPASWEQRI
jgi:arsenate reductase (glutaredoxin)